LRWICSVEAGSGDCKDARFEAVTELGQVIDCAVLEGLGGEFDGFGEADDAGDVLSAGAAAALVAASDEQRLERRSAADEQSADALGAVDLVGADGAEMAAEAADVKGDAACALDGVDVKEGGGGAGDLCNLFDGLEDAGFVVGEHDADEAGVGLESLANGFRVNEAGGLGRDVCDFNAMAGEALGGLKDRGVLDGGGDEMVAGAEQAEESGVVALSAAGVEDDLGGMAVEEIGEGFTGAVDGGVGLLAVEMDGGGVAEVLDPVGAHGVDHLGQQGGGGVCVHVDTEHGEDSPTS